MTKLQIWHTIQRQQPKIAASIKAGERDDIPRFINAVLGVFGEDAVASFTIEGRRHEW